MRLPHARPGRRLGAHGDQTLGRGRMAPIAHFCGGSVATREMANGTRADEKKGGACERFQDQALHAQFIE